MYLHHVLGGKVEIFLISLRTSRRLANSSVSMPAVFASRSLLYWFHICGLVNEVPNFFKVDMIPPIAEKESLWLLEPSYPFPFDRLDSIPTNGTSHLLLDCSLTRGDKCIHCGWGIQPCPPLALIPNSFPSVEALEFGTSLILISLLCNLNNYAIVDSALLVQKLLIINLIEEWYILVVGYPIIF
jgi:hypothetical protein